MKKDLIIALGVLSVLVSLLFTQFAAGQAGQVHTTWEYGELVIQGENAYFAVQEELHELHPPTTRTHGGSSQRTDWGRVHYKTSVKLLHLNRLGQEGWELISTAAIEDGFAYTMRRARR